jgi:SHS2 domain-containing protein
MGAFEILEHTADVGVRATGSSVEEVFEQATIGLFTIVGVWRPDGGEPVDVTVEAPDLGALLVDWLSEVLYLHDTRDALVTGVKLEHVRDGRAIGSVLLAGRGDDEPTGTQVKAITYHQLEVDETSEGWTARFYVDV